MGHIGQLGARDRTAAGTRTDPADSSSGGSRRATCQEAGARCGPGCGSSEAGAAAAHAAVTPSPRWLARRSPEARRTVWRLGGRGCGGSNHERQQAEHPWQPGLPGTHTSPSCRRAVHTGSLFLESA
jgi:hypothetical protein